MTTSRFAVILILVLAVDALAGCAKHQPATLEEALALYRENKLQEALPLLEQLVKQDEGSSQNLVWLAETYRRLGKKDEAVKMARRALELNPLSSFAHTVIAEASNPVTGQWAQANSDTTWVHLLKAVECDSADGNPWLLIWGEAIHRGEGATMRKALRRIAETGFLTKAALAYGRWMLRGLPEKAILLTNGDMDTYPPCVVQEVEGFRKDVVVVNRGTLNTAWYARFIRDDAGVSLPVDDAQLEHLEAYKDAQGNIVTPSDQIVRGWVRQKAKGLFERPLTVAVTVDEEIFSGFRDNMRYAGAFLQWHDAATAKTPDVAAMRASLDGESPDSFTGPWVSVQDRSPIRRVSTRNIVRTVTLTAVSCSESFLRTEQFPEAKRWALWAEELDRKAELGPVFTDRIAQLKEILSKAAR